MLLGWVDYSLEEADKIKKILRMLSEKTAIDELGIGTIRDYFSDKLFPGISTLQTRAKYFVIMPYIFADIEKRIFKNQSEVISSLRAIENGIVKPLINNSSKKACTAEGIIGRRAALRNSSVKIPPSSIYWNGLKKISVINDPNLSIGDFFNIIYSRSQRKHSLQLKRDEEYDAQDNDDVLLEDDIPYLPLAHDYNDYKKDMTIELTRKEAEYLYERFTTSAGTKNSLMAYLLRNNSAESIRNYEFENLEVQQMRNMPQEMMIDITKAQRFAEFIYGAHRLYNIIFSKNKDYEELNEFSMWLKSYQHFNIDDIVPRYVYNDQTRKFLIEFDKFMLSHKIDSAKRLIINRERELKGARSKLSNLEKNIYENPVHPQKLNYRFNTAKTIINDIAEGMRKM